MRKSFEVVVIGAGPAGYIAAIRCAQLGFSTAVVEEWKNDRGEGKLGGTCLNVGCIPSKALLESSENYERLAHKFGNHGISVTGAKIDVAKMQARKDKIVSELTGGIEFLFRKNKITWLKGHGKFAGSGEKYLVEVAAGGSAEIVEANHVVIATGSTARHLPGLAVDNDTVCDNIGALAFNAVPDKLGVIGAGVIGLELGSVWRRLGAKVTVLEALPEFLAAADEAVAKEAWKVFVKEQGLQIDLGVKIGKVSRGKRGITVEYETSEGKRTLDCDKLVVSVGRVPNTRDLGADTVGLKIDERGCIEVDEYCRTSLPNVYAVGDVVRGPMLAHKGMDEGVMVAERIAGQSGCVNLDTVPWVIYTAPEIAWVGKSERQLKAAGVAYRAGQAPFSRNGRAMGQDETAGFVKILAEAKTDRVLGVHIIGSHASEMIAEAVMALEFSASAEDIARICHAHPSLSEVMHEAALALDKRALHS
ncbi:MAG: dihydrolipoyl dehydrogenase [Betaproteobacteria bacterium]|nr:MAG: dihydrolipoyl dehydrogenase [Betaproteobacteria bacterium]